MAKNIARTARRQLDGRHLLFGEEFDEHAQSKMNVTSMEVCMFLLVSKTGIILNE